MKNRQFNADISSSADISAHSDLSRRRVLGVPMPLIREDIAVCASSSSSVIRNSRLSTINSGLLYLAFQKYPERFCQLAEPANRRAFS